MGLHRIRKVLNPDKGYPCVFRNWKANSHCNLLHGYDLIFSVTLECNKNDLDYAGQVFDFGAFKRIKMRLDEIFDHKLIVASDDPDRERIMDLKHAGIADVIELPTVGAEAFALWLCIEVFDLLCHTNRDKVVRIVETECRENGANSGFWRS